MTGVGKDAEERVIDRRVEIGVGKDDVRRFAAQLERDLLEIRRRILHDAAPGLGAARKRDFIDERTRGDRMSDSGARARDDVDDAGREFELSKIVASRIAESGVSSEGFRTQTLPAASAGASFQVAISSG